MGSLGRIFQVRQSNIDAASPADAESTGSLWKLLKQY